MSTTIPETEGPRAPGARLWAPGNAVLALGEDGDGVPALALWHVSPEGTATGSWIIAQEQAFGDADSARRLLVGIERRALTAADLAVVGEIAARLTAAAGLAAGEWWPAQRFSPVGAFAEIVERRAAVEAVIAEARAARRTVADLEWTREIPTDERPRTFDELRLLAGIGVADGPPVVSSVLTVSRVLAWLVTVWTEIEQVKARRSYVRERLGAPEALPPTWAATVSTAAKTRLPL